LGAIKEVSNEPPHLKKGVGGIARKGVPLPEGKNGKQLIAQGWKQEQNSQIDSPDPGRRTRKKQGGKKKVKHWVNSHTTPKKNTQKTEKGPRTNFYRIFKAITRWGKITKLWGEARHHPHC